MRRRKMTRDFRPDPVDAALVDEVLDSARRVPTAGNSQGLEFLVLDEPAAIERYWSTTFSAASRASFRWQGLFDAPVLISVYGDPAVYIDRYSEPDKTRAGLTSVEAWTTPYWLVDASMATLAVQLGAIDLGLGVLLFGQFDHAASVAEEFGVPDRLVTTGTIALGWPTDAGSVPARGAETPADAASSGSGSGLSGSGLSAARPKRVTESMIHRNHWNAAG